MAGQHLLQLEEFVKPKLTLFSLSKQMLIGVAVMVLSFPLNAVIARLQTRMQKRQMGNRDARTRLMNEILNNIKSIKLYSASTSSVYLASL